MRLPIGFTALLIVLSIHAAAQAPCPPENDLVATPNRPTVSNTAETTQCGVLELEYGVELGSTHQDMNGLLKFGATKDLELRFSSDPLIADIGSPITGAGDFQLGAKYRLVHQKGNVPTISFSYTANLPTAQGNLGSGAVDHFLLLMVSKDFGKHHIDFNAQPGWYGRPHAVGFDHNWTIAGAWSHPIRGNWGIGAELSGYTRQNVAIPGEMQAIVNLDYAPKPRLVLDFGVIKRIYGNAPNAMFEAGLTYSIADLYRRSHQFLKSEGRSKK